MILTHKPSPVSLLVDLLYTTVTWTRHSTTVTQGTQTVLNDPVTAENTHTLTMTFAGEYTCTVANNKPSHASASIIVAGMTQLLVGLQRVGTIYVI